MKIRQLRAKIGPQQQITVRRQHGRAHKRSVRLLRAREKPNQMCKKKGERKDHEKSKLRGQKRRKARRRMAVRRKCRKVLRAASASEKLKGQICRRTLKAT